MLKNIVIKNLELRSQIKRSDDSKIDEEFVETEPAVKSLSYLFRIKFQIDSFILI